MGNETIQKNTTSSVSNTAKYVRAISTTEIEVVFKNGTTKVYDTSSLQDEYPKIKEAFKSDCNLFFQVHLDPGGYGIIWNDEIDVAIEDVWKKGRVINTEFDNLLSMKDATTLWGLNESTLRKAIASGKLVEGIDARKFGKQWILVKAAVEREYGKLK